MSDVDRFGNTLNQLLEWLKNETSSGDSRRKYASGEMNDTQVTKVYGLMQCTPDLSKDQCDRCLHAAIGQLPICCDHKRGARVMFPSCMIWYEDNKFFKDAVALDPLPPKESSLPPPMESSTPSPPLSPPPGKSHKTTIVIIVVVATISLVIFVTVFIFFFARRKGKLGCRSEKSVPYHGDINEVTIAKSLQYSFDIIKAATDNFSDSNRLGHGGFGVVYKGKLENGKEIAVKRLLKDSNQGEEEFKNEVVLLARLQHQNLVQLHGYCIKGSERILIYEFVPNAGLDQFIYDPIKRANLDWKRRYQIISGIARGIMYLHKDSRLKIIHRDLKASNVLLDAQMNPKIADFGIARLFTPEETHATTCRIIGTRGYMAPEYGLHGQYSVKSDVFSFGVLLLEIVTGQKCHSFLNGEVTDDLLSHAWRSWRDGTASSLIDSKMRNESDSQNEMIRCIHIGLLCVQENASDRPTMDSVVLMISSSSLPLEIPSEPAFFAKTSTNQ